MEPPAGRPRGGALLAAALLVAAATAAVHGQALSFPFLPYDDDLYVTANPLVLGGLTAEGAREAFLTFREGCWQPLAWLSHMADVSLFGLDAAGHHGVNVLLHGANALLLLGILARWTGAPWRSALVSALFALHPLHVEPVAWVAERRHLLSSLFLLLSLLSYGRYAEAPGRLRMAATALPFALGLMAKPSIVPLPFLLLLLDWWPLGRFAGAGGPAAALPRPGGGAGRGATEEGGRPGEILRRALSLAGEKAPLFLLAGASCAVTLVAQGAAGGTAAADRVAPLARLANAFASYGGYLRRAFLPYGLAAWYPYPPAGRLAAEGVAGALLLAAATWGALRLRGSRPWLAAGWSWYLVALVPMIGVVQLGNHAMADRYGYLPLAGIFLAVAWEAGEAAARRPRLRRPVVAASVAAVALLAAAAHRQASYWKDDEALFRRAAEVTEGNWFALNALGYDLLERGLRGEAVPLFEASARLRPAYALPRFNLGRVAYAEGRYGEALLRFREAVELDPSLSDGWLGAGRALWRQGRTAEAAAPLLEAVRREPRNAEALADLGGALAELGRRDEAAARFADLLALRPGDGRALRGLALLSGAAGGGEPPSAGAAAGGAVYLGHPPARTRGGTRE